MTRALVWVHPHSIHALRLKPIVFQPGQDPHGISEGPSTGLSGPFQLHIGFVALRRPLHIPQEQDSFHVCEELLGMEASNVFYFYFYAWNLIQREKWCVSGGHAQMFFGSRAENALKGDWGREGVEGCSG